MLPKKPDPGHSFAQGGSHRKSVTPVVQHVGPGGDVCHPPHRLALVKELQPSLGFSKQRASTSVANIRTWDIGDI